MPYKGLFSDPLGILSDSAGNTKISFSAYLSKWLIVTLNQNNFKDLYAIFLFAQRRTSNR